MTKLTKLQTALIEQALARTDSALQPAPETAATSRRALDRALNGLVRMGLAARSAACGDEAAEDGALVLTDAGRAALAPEEAETSTADVPPSAAPSPYVPTGKLGIVLKAIGRKRGATLAELTEATGWQPHTTRAALTRLRQRGYPAALTEEAGRKAYRLQG